MQGPLQKMDVFLHRFTRGSAVLRFKTGGLDSFRGFALQI